MSWEKVKGHESIVTAFQNVVARKRLAHSYLLIGPDGIGKKLFAVEFARAYFCEQRQVSSALQACHQCSSCQLISAGTHPDLFIVNRPEDKNEMPIDVIRDLCRNLSLKSARGHGKIAIIDDADDLNAESANCFLKTLEEPPPGSVFFLIGTDRNRQLPTILSRCQIVRFAPLPKEVLLELLMKQGVDDQKFANQLVRLANGSLGQAMALANPDLWQFRGKLLRHLATPRIDPVAVTKAIVSQLETAGKEAAAQRRHFELVLRLLVEFLREVLQWQLGFHTDGNEREEEAILQSVAARFSEDSLMTLIDSCLECEMQLSLYVQTALVVEALVDAICREETITI